MEVVEWLFELAVIENSIERLSLLLLIELLDLAFLPATIVNNYNLLKFDDLQWELTLGYRRGIVLGYWKSTLSPLDP